MLWMFSSLNEVALHSRPLVNAILPLVAHEHLFFVLLGSYISCLLLLNLIDYAAQKDHRGL
jgi:hypothetical protein